ncbi:Possible phosphinothricin N-acetyltransferase [Amycolatopsis camponoti]|uniref:Possible phosphinothricin N-acetyltransferase n=1 Tax=Amycolatopsis camponoti TaxID=2606593 RepID=A0A6I8LPV0_9PSEU|nr:metalloregulator ArsR/SmtB family transcription factor [Amycolatopsis camponoti]VVJ18498.1 Possible phosphinothricin N-acetyltransferase [Amycolatopsis camponoti]
MTTTAPDAALLPVEDAATYAEWFACLADTTRVRILHAVAAAGKAVTIGEITEQMAISQSNCSHHVRKLADVGFVRLRKVGTATLVSVNASCAVSLPHAADVVMGLLAPKPTEPGDLAPDVTVRPLRVKDWPAVRRIYAEGIATGDATFETEVPPRTELEAKWLRGHRWVAEVDGQVAGWAAAATVSSRDCYAGVAETSVYVGEKFRGRGVGKALMHQLVTAADEGELWTLQTSIFPENRNSVALHHGAGFRTVGIRERIGELDGRWRDTVLLERRRASQL